MLPRSLFALCCGSAVAVTVLAGCERPSQPANSGAAAGAPSLRQVAIDRLEKAAADPAHPSDAVARMEALIAQLKSGKPVPRTLLTAFYVRGREQPGLEVMFYDESQSVNGLRLKSPGNQPTLVYNYIVYEHHDRSNRPLERLAIDGLSERPADLGDRGDLRVRRAPGGSIYAWIPELPRGAQAEVCLIDEAGQEYGCIPLIERPAPATNPASRAH